MGCTLKSLSSSITPLELPGEEPQPAIRIKNGYKTYNSKQAPVLDNFNLVIPKGCVYVLLGNSGSGKSTLLRCILGLDKLNKGNIHLFGRNVLRFTKSSVSVGYMPQEISLYPEFSIGEILAYFGTLYGTIDINSKIRHLAETLNLPRLSSPVEKLSGGEQRRVSLAVALIHTPDLLVLDEPTGGIDPLIRHKIWEYLRSLAQSKQVTVLLTTHYTDEVRRADMFGVIRNGRIILEDSPHNMVDIHGNWLLDQAILQRCKDMDSGYVPEAPTNPTQQKSLLRPGMVFQLEAKPKNELTVVPSSFSRIQALIGKNKTIMIRHLGVYVFAVVMPAIIILTTCIGIKNVPRYLPLGVVNEQQPGLECDNGNVLQGNNCLSGSLSCKFLAELSDSDTLYPVHFSTAQKAVDAVKRGLSWGVITFPTNFSTALVDRVVMGAVDDATWNMSTITVQIDQSNSMIHATLTSTLFQALARFYQRVVRECDPANHTVALPLNYRDPPLVGSSSHEYLDYLGPGMCFIWMFFCPSISTSVQFITEKKRGTLARTLLGSGQGRGASLWEIWVALWVTETGVIFLQSILSHLIIVVGFQIGGGTRALISTKTVLVLALFVISGWSGFCFGFLAGIMFAEEMQAGLFAMAIFLPVIFVSGIVWPIQGMPQWLQYISPFLPFTRPCESLRSLLNRGWEFTHPIVWSGFVVIFAYIFIYLVLLVIISCRFKKLT